jgi:hypothetical protein
MAPTTKLAENWLGDGPGKNQSPVADRLAAGKKKTS